jgi:hypothetical protein
MLSEDKFTEVEEKQANTSVKQAEQDRRRRQIYGSGRKTSQYFRKADRARMLSEDKFTEVEEKEANTSVKQAEQDRRRRQIYGSGRKTSRYFRKPTGQECRQEKKAPSPR